MKLYRVMYSWYPEQSQVFEQNIYAVSTEEAALKFRCMIGWDLVITRIERI